MTEPLADTTGLSPAEAAAAQASQHASRALRTADLADRFTYGDGSGTTEAHTAGIGLAAQAQVSALLAVASELRALRLTLGAEPRTTVTWTTTRYPGGEAPS